MKKSCSFHISVQNIDCRYWLEPPQQGGSNEYPQSMFLSKNKNSDVYPYKRNVSLALCCFVVYSTRRFVVCLSMCHFVLVFFSPSSIAITCTSLGEERANLSAFRTFVRFVLVWICRFPLPLGVWEGLQFVIVALPGLFSHLFLKYKKWV